VHRLMGGIHARFLCIHSRTHATNSSQQSPSSTHTGLGRPAIFLCSPRSDRERSAPVTMVVQGGKGPASPLFPFGFEWAPPPPPPPPPPFLPSQNLHTHQLIRKYTHMERHTWEGETTAIRVTVADSTDVDTLRQYERQKRNADLTQVGARPLPLTHPNVQTPTPHTPDTHTPTHPHTHTHTHTTPPHSLRATGGPSCM
jgi:hypothetical protein